jgi:hypothetical protein
VIVRSSWAERESVLVEAYEAESLVFRRWEEFHRKALGCQPSWALPVLKLERTQRGPAREARRT